MAYDKVDNVDFATGNYTTSNVVTTRALNANINDTLITSDVLATLIEDLKTLGILV